MCTPGDDEENGAREPISPHLLQVVLPLSPLFLIFIFRTFLSFYLEEFLNLNLEDKVQDKHLFMNATDVLWKRDIFKYFHLWTCNTDTDQIKDHLTNN